MSKYHAALESIQFQKTGLFKDITECVKKIRTLNKNQKDSAYYNSAEVNSLSAVIEKYTGVLFEFVDGEGPAVFVPRLAQTVLDDSEMLIQISEMYDDFEVNYDLQRVLKTLNAQAVNGTVDLKNSKVTGIFTKIKCKMILPKNYTHNKSFLDEELAAVILHELGHVFTSFEYLSRTATTNQALSIMLRMMDKTVRDEDRKMVFAKAKEKLKMDEGSYKLITDEKNKNVVTLVVMNERIQQSKSELGQSIYDINSCEYLADQFAARHGAGRYLVSALDKLIEHDSDSGNYFAMLIGGIFVFLTPLSIATGVFVSLIAIVFIGLVAKSYSDVGSTYDNNHARLSRIKHQMIQRLKEPNVDKDEKETIVKYIQEIDPVINKYVNDTNLKLRNKIAFFFSSDHKRAYEYTVLQKELEALGNNDLYVMSEKLKLI